MKKQLFSLLILLVFGCALHAQDSTKIKWRTTNEAFELQKKEPKKILIDIYTDGCGWCKRLDALTFTNPEVIAYLNKHYYCVRFNAEGKENVTFNAMNFVNDGQYGKFHSFAVALLQGNMSFPSIAYFDEKPQLLTVVGGYMPPEQILPVLAYFGEDGYKTKDFQVFSAEYSKKNSAQAVNR
jgi:thioredoxin-related protein